VLQLLGVTGVLTSEVPKAAYYRLKPYGLIVLVETKESRARSAIEAEIRKTGIAWQSDGWIFGVEGPDDQTLDTLENRMRAKVGWDAQHTRYVTLAKAKLVQADLPAGYTLGKTPLENTELYTNEIQGPQGALKLRLIAAQEHPDYEKGKKFAGVKPADIVLASDRDYVAVFVGGGAEADWPALDVLEAALRKRMRTGPVRVEHLTIEGFLPENCKLTNRRDLGFPQNPKLYKSPTAVQVGLKDLWAADLTGIVRAWSAIIDPAETQVFLLQVADGVKTSEITLRLRKASAASKHLSIREKGSIVAVIRTDRAEDAEFKAIDELVRARLRVK